MGRKLRLQDRAPFDTMFSAMKSTNQSRKAGDLI
jgi:hypothetical protein